MTGHLVRPVIHSKISVSARFRKPLQEPCTVFLVANGDLVSPAVRLFIPRKTLNQWEHVLEMVTEKITLRNGAVHRLYTLDGKPVESGLDLENGQFYVAVGRDKFKKLPYSEVLFTKSTVRRSYGSKSSEKSKGSSKSTDTGDIVSSPPPSKRKEKHRQNQESKKPEKSKENIQVVTKTYILPDHVSVWFAIEIVALMSSYALHAVKQLKGVLLKGEEFVLFRKEHAKTDFRKPEVELKKN
uniref:Uncharacterized protein n=1 Tax=Sphaerodactylus townsendi TaxID=933632 RepID=A0ACB8FDF8_9SAUR